MDFSVWSFLGGLALVLFGMELLETAIHDLSGIVLKRWLKKVANTPLKAILSSFGITTILQSSSVVTLMILAFVGAGLLTLPNAIGAIIGANVGSTMLGILVVYVGFSFKIATFSLAMIALGGLMNKFLINIDWKNVGKVILSFGLLFFGISILRDSVEVFAKQLDFAALANMSYVIWFFIGIIFTAILHSSGAMTIITLGALHGGLIDFPQSMAIIAGANIGTCITAVRGSISGGPLKKQVAASHVLFNAVSGTLVLFFLVPISKLFYQRFDFSTPGAPETALAVFQLSYNILGAILFYPFIGPIARLLQKIFYKENTDYKIGVSNILLSDIETAIPVLRKDIIMLFKKVFKFNVHHLRIDQKALLKPDVDFNTKVALEYVLNNTRFNEDYQNLKTIEEELQTFVLRSLGQNLTQQQVTKLHLSSNAIERVVYAAKARQDVERNIMMLYQTDNDFIKNKLLDLKTHMIKLYTHIIPILDDRDVSKNYESVVRATNEIRRENKALIDDIGDYIAENTLERGVLSSLMRVIRGFERSNESIMDALKYVFLDEEQRKYANIAANTN